MTPNSLTANELQDRLDILPRAKIAVLPTGLQPLPRLAQRVGVAEFLVKRDDLTGIGMGGNKSRAMEFILGAALSEGADTLVAGGGAEQSNHAVQCVAAANRVGLKTIMVLQRRPGARGNGNALLHDILGGETRWLESDPDLTDRGSAAAHMHAVADGIAEKGGHPYVLESSLHPLSVIAYVNAFLELRRQLGSAIDRPTRLYITSEGAALGGLLLAKELLRFPCEIVGLDWRPQQPGTVEGLSVLIDRAAALLNVPNPVQTADILIKTVGGPAYGVGSPASWAALSTAAHLEGLLLDPVYTAKGFAGALDDLQERSFSEDGRVVFIHTGGVGALFAYQAELRRYCSAVGGGGAIPLPARPGPNFP